MKVVPLKSPPSPKGPSRPHNTSNFRTNLSTISNSFRGSFINNPSFHLEDDPIETPSQINFATPKSITEDIDDSPEIFNSTDMYQDTEISQIQDIKDITDSQLKVEFGPNSQIEVPEENDQFCEDELIESEGASQFFNDNLAVASFLEDITYLCKEWNFGFTRIIRAKIQQCPFEEFEIDSEISIISSNDNIKSLHSSGQTFVFKKPFYALSFNQDLYYIIPNCSITI